MSSAAAAPEKKRRFARVRDTWRVARRVDPNIGWIAAAVFLGVYAIAILLGLLFRQVGAAAFVGVPTALLAATFVFGRRLEAGSYRMVEGKPGAAGGVLETLKRGWTTTPAVAVTREQDLVHRTVGRAGVVLVGEGAPSRVGRLLVQERKRHARVALDTPVIEIVVGDGEGEVPLRKLAKHVRKLPKQLSGGQVTELNSRLRALRSQPLPVPKGPMPRSGRVPRPTNPRQR